MLIDGEQLVERWHFRNECHARFRSCLIGFQVEAVDQYPAICWTQDAGHASERSRLPCSVRPEQPYDLAIVDLKAQTIDRSKVLILLDELIDLEHGRDVSCAMWAVGCRFSV